MGQYKEIAPNDPKHIGVYHGASSKSTTGFAPSDRRAMALTTQPLGVYLSRRDWLSIQNSPTLIDHHTLDCEGEL